MYSDEKLSKMVNYGLEGKHYTLNEDGTFNQTDVFYDVGPVTPGCFNDAYKLDVHLDYPGYEALSKKLDDMTEINPSVSMPTDDTNVREIKVALKEIYNQYSLPRLYGVFDGTAEEVLKAEVEKLKAAGIDEYIADLQKQLDAYYAEISE